MSMAIDESAAKARKESRLDQYRRQLQATPVPEGGLDLADEETRSRLGLPPLADDPLASKVKDMGLRTVLGLPKPAKPFETPERNPGRPLVNPASRKPLADLRSRLAAAGTKEEKRKVLYCPGSGMFGCPSRGFARDAANISNWAMLDPVNFAVTVMFAPLSAMLPFNLYAPKFPFLAHIVASVGEDRDDVRGGDHEQGNEFANAIMAVQAELDKPDNVGTRPGKDMKQTSRFNLKQLIFDQNNPRAEMLVNLWNKRATGHNLFKTAGQLVDQGDSDQAYHAILDCYRWLVGEVGGMQAVKAGFAIQLTLNLAGCIDVHNISIYSALVKAYFGRDLEEMAKARGPSQKGERQTGPDALVRAIQTASDSPSDASLQRYMDLLRQLDDQIGVSTEALWNFWCDYVSQYHAIRYKGHWANMGSVWSSDDDPTLRRLLPTLKGMDALPRWIDTPDAGDQERRDIADILARHEEDTAAWRASGRLKKDRKGPEPRLPKKIPGSDRRFPSKMPSGGRGADFYLGGVFPERDDERVAKIILTGRWPDGRPLNGLDRETLLKREIAKGRTPRQWDMSAAQWDSPAETEPGRKYGHRSGDAVSFMHNAATSASREADEGEGYQNILRALVGGARPEDIPVFASLGDLAGPGGEDKRSFIEMMRKAAQVIAKLKKQGKLGRAKGGQYQLESKSWFGPF